MAITSGPRRAAEGSDTGTGQAAGLPAAAGAGLFTRAALEYAAHRPGQALVILQAGCITAGGAIR